MKRATATVCSLVWIVMLLPLQATACSYFPPTYKVGTSFNVHVASGDGLAFAGVRVIVVRGSRVVNSVRTDRQGLAHFQDLQYGEYSLEIDQLGIAGWDTAQLIVSGKQEINDIKLQWPSARILRSNEVKGSLIDSRNAKPLKNTSIELVNWLDGSLIARTLTQERGTFDLGTPDAGLYFLKIDTLRSGDWEPKGVIPIVVASDSKRRLELAVGQNSCGLLYSTLCRAKPAIMSRVRGKLTDIEGAPIDRAEIDLLRSTGAREPIETTVPDKMGNFAIRNVSPGEYQMRVSSVGFAPLFVPLTVTTSSELDRSIDLKLDVLGSSCADGNVDKETSRAD